VEDITELMESYQREKRLKEEWFKLFNSVPESIIILSENQTILDANETTMKLLGKNKSEIVGKKCYQLFHNTSMPPEGCPFIELMKRGGNFQLNEMTMETLDGRYLVTVAPYILPGESKRKFMHFAKDVTIIYKVQEKLINHLKQHNQILNIINDIQRVLFREKNVHPNLGLHDLSSGIKKVLLIITDVISMTGDSIYLLDEYENSLGLNAIDFLPSFLNECGHDNQFVVTTHHPYLINNMPTENWKIFHREGSKVSIKCGAEMSEKYKHSKQDAFIQLINDPFYSEGAS